MKEEFNLSEKVFKVKNIHGKIREYAPKEDVEEFIKLLKEDMISFFIRDNTWGGYGYDYSKKEIKRRIDKLAGDKLI